MIKKMLSAIYGKMRLKRENNRILQMDWINVNPIKNEKPNKIEKIVFVIPCIDAYGGGITSILRLGSYLAVNGYDITYADYSENQSIQDMENNAKICLSDYKGKVAYLNDVIDCKFDIVIATNTMSVYYANRLSGYKMTFVQDYEPLFYAAGDWHYFAIKSYQLGFHMVSLGEWNKSMILKNVDESLQIDSITFPYEKREYHYIKRDFDKYKDKKKFRLCVYMRETPRRLPGICQLVTKKLQEKFAANGKELEVLYFGFKNKIYKFGANLGQLSKSELNNLYQSCDFGMIASYTNISLIPYEMMATGLPIIEIKNGSFPFFFNDAAFLFDLNYDQLYREIDFAINNPKILIDRDMQIQEKLSGLSWANTAEEFETIIKNLVI